MSVKISVILPTFNREQSLTAAIMSVLTQSIRDIELIVVDDGSSEDIEGAVRAIDDHRIRYIKRTTNGGAAAARNTGLLKAEGEYIAFQDSDDLWLPKKLEYQLGLFSTLPSHVGVVTGAKILYGRDEQSNYGPGKICYAPPSRSRLRLDGDQIGHLLTENRLSVQNALFRKDCFPSKTWFDPCAKANEDWDFAVRLVQYTSIYEDLGPVVLGFVSSDSISKSERRDTMGVLRVLKKNRAILSSYKYKKQKSLMLLDVGRWLYKSGKKNIGRKFLIASIREYPLNSLRLVSAIMKRLRNKAFSN